MTTEFNRAVLRVCVAQISQQLGWQAMQSTPMEVLTDVLERYILSLGRLTHRYSEQFGRTDPNLDDLGLSFQDHNIRLDELEAYVQHVDAVPFAHKLPQYPVQRPDQLRFPRPNSRELAEREEHIHDHLPPMNPEWDDEVLDSGSATLDGVPGSTNVGTVPSAAGAATRDSPTVGVEKRPYTGPTDAPAAKKVRMLPEEAGHSQYQMKGIVVADSGLLTPVRAGKLADSKAPPTRLMSTSSVHSEISVGSPPPVRPVGAGVDGFDSSPPSSPHYAHTAISSEAMDAHMRYGAMEDLIPGAKKPELVLTGTEDIVKPTDAAASDKLPGPARNKGKFKKKIKTFKENKLKQKGLKKKLKSPAIVTPQMDPLTPSGDVAPVAPALPVQHIVAHVRKKKLKHRLKKFKTNPSVTILPDGPITADGKSPRGRKSPRGSSPKKMPHISINLGSPRSPGRSPGRSSLSRSPGRSPKRSPARSPVKSPLKSPKMKSPGKIKGDKLSKEKKSPGRPRKPDKPEKKSKKEKGSKLKLKKMLHKKQHAKAAAAALSEMLTQQPLPPDGGLAQVTGEPEFQGAQPLPLHEMPPQTPSPAPTEAAEHEEPDGALSDYQDAVSPGPPLAVSPGPPLTEPDQPAPDDIIKPEPEELEKPKTPEVETSEVEPVPLSSYESQNETTAEAPPEPEVENQDLQKEVESSSPASAAWSPPPSAPPAPASVTMTPPASASVSMTAQQKLDAFHFSASDTDNDDNDFSFLAQSVQEKIQDMDKDNSKDEFAFSDDEGDGELNISVGVETFPEAATVPPPVAPAAPPVPSFIPPAATVTESPTKSPKKRGRPAKKEKATKLKIKIGAPPKAAPSSGKKKKQKQQPRDISSPEWPKVELAKLTPDDIRRFDFPSPESAGLSIKMPGSPPFSPTSFSPPSAGGGAPSSAEPSLPPSASPEPLPTVAPMKISVGGGTTKFTIKMGGKSDDSKTDEKKKKKKKNKDKDKEKSKEERKKEKSSKKKDKKKDKKEKEGATVPKLLLRFGGGDGGVSVSSSPSGQDTKPEGGGIPKLLIKPLASAPSNPASVSPRPTSLSPIGNRSPDVSPYHMSPLRPTSPSSSPSNSTVPRTPSPALGRRPSESPGGPRSPLTSVLRSPSLDDSSSSRSPSPTGRTPPRFAGAGGVALPPPPPSSKGHSYTAPAPPKAESYLPPRPASNPKPPPPVVATPVARVKKGSRAIIMETQGKIYDEKGDIIWICPSCKMPDDGSPMIGCDTCDDWYHWVCVNITAEPSDDKWFCPRCVLKNLGADDKKKRGRKPKAGRGRGKKKAGF